MRIKNPGEGRAGAASTDEEQRAGRSGRIARWIFAVAAAAFGIVLLVVGKVGAGSAFVLAALVASSIERVGIPKRLSIALVLVLSVVGIIGISSTDIPPVNATTGIRLADQVLTLLREFRARIR